MFGRVRLQSPGCIIFEPILEQADGGIAEQKPGQEEIQVRRHVCLIQSSDSNRATRAASRHEIPIKPTRYFKVILYQPLDWNIPPIIIFILLVAVIYGPMRSLCSKQFCNCCNVVIALRSGRSLDVYLVWSMRDNIRGKYALNHERNIIWIDREEARFI